MTRSPKRALLISPYFPPSNLAGVHRVRLLATRLAEFGWEPIVITVDSRCYEEMNDDGLTALLPEGLRVERVDAWPASVCRPLGFGDVSLRAQRAMRRKVAELIKRGGVDLIFATVLPGYTSLVGAWAKRTFGIPFVLDYQDPWVSVAGAQVPRWSKAGLAHWLAVKLEPKAVSAADAITAVSNETLGTLRTRRLLKSSTLVEIIPIGADLEDHIVAARLGRSRIVKRPGVFDLAYLGTLTERMLPALRGLLLAVKQLTAGGQMICVHLIGTSAQPAGADTVGVAQIIRELEVSEYVRLEPGRQPYLDALRTMQDADALLLLGSTDSHYTASKIFPCWLAKRPILGLFHAASTVNPLARELGGVTLVTYGANSRPESRANELVAALRKVIADPIGALANRNEAAFEPYSARGVARRYAALFDHISNQPKR